MSGETARFPEYPDSQWVIDLAVNAIVIRHTSRPGLVRAISEANFQVTLIAWGLIGMKAVPIFPSSPLKFQIFARLFGDQEKAGCRAALLCPVANTTRGLSL